MSKIQIICQEGALFITLSQLSCTWRKGYSSILVHSLVRTRGPGVMADCLLQENEHQRSVTSM